MTFILSLCSSAVSAFLLFFLCQSIGWSWIDRCLAGWENSPRTRACVRLMASFGVGLWIVAVTVMLWGMSVGLSFEKNGVLWLALILGGRSSFVPIGRTYREVFAGLRLGCVEKIGVGILAAIAGWGLVFALVPPLLTDTIRYHLGVPQLWWNHGLIEKLPHFSEQHLVMMWQHASLLLIGLDQPVAAKVFCFLAYPLTLLAVGLVVNARCGRVAALFSCLMLAATPTFFGNSVLGGVDAGLAFFTAMALLFFLQDRPQWIWAGVMAGLACCTKWQGMVLLPALAIAALVGRPRPDYVRVVCVAALFCALMFIPWGLRNFFWSHDPFYPFLSQYFSAEPSIVASRFSRLLAHYGLSGQPWWQYALYPLHLSFADCPFWFGGRIAFESQIGWMYLLMLPFCAIAFYREPGLRPLLAFTAASFVLGLMQGQLPRFLLPAWVAYAAACGSGWRRLGLPMRGSLFAALGLIAACNLVGISDILNQNGFAPLSYYRRAEEPDTFYRRIKPEWRAATWTRLHYPDSRVLLVGLDGNFFWKNEIEVDGPFDDKTLVEMAALPGGLEGMVAHLKASGIGMIAIDSTRAELLESQFGYMGWNATARKAVVEFFLKRVKRVYQDGSLQIGVVE